MAAVNTVINTQLIFLVFTTGIVQMNTDVSGRHAPCIFNVLQSIRPENAGSTIIRNVEIHLQGNNLKKLTSVKDTISTLNNTDSS